MLGYKYYVWSILLLQETSCKWDRNVMWVVSWRARAKWQTSLECCTKVQNIHMYTHISDYEFYRPDLHGITKASAGFQGESFVCSKSRRIKSQCISFIPRKNHLKKSWCIIPLIHCITVTPMIKNQGKTTTNHNWDKGLLCLVSTQMAMLPSEEALTEPMPSERPLHRQLVRINISAIQAWTDK